jgi:AraC-like DNA-binding protein
MKAATRLLTHHPELNITEIAFRCGFQSSQYFSNVFRKQHGHSPNANTVCCIVPVGCEILLGGSSASAKSWVAHAPSRVLPVDAYRMTEGKIFGHGTLIMR